MYRCNFKSLAFNARLACALLGLGALAGPADAVAASATQDNSPCPDLSGHYRVAEFGDTNGDALKALRIPMAGFIDSEVRFKRGSGQDWSLFIKSGGSGRLSGSAATTLTHGVDFACRGGWVELLTPVRTSRKTEQGWFEGKTTLLLNKASPSGLTLSARFSGGKRSTLYQQLSLPIPGTGIRLNESIRWPDISEPAPPSTDIAPPAPEVPAVAQTRQRLSASLLGPVLLAGLQPADLGVRATLKATRSEQVAALDERLRNAGIGYQVLRQPIWSGNAYHFELLILPAGSIAPWRPSLLWVEQELRRTRHPLAEPGSVQADPQGYRVTLTLSGSVQAQEVATRIQTLSGAFAEVRVDEPHGAASAPEPGHLGARSARLLLVMK
jgi:hypothetical protein